jgi:hypothetical protein
MSDFSFETQYNTRVIYNQTINITSPPTHAKNDEDTEIEFGAAPGNRAVSEVLGEGGETPFDVVVEPTGALVVCIVPPGVVPGACAVTVAAGELGAGLATGEATTDAGALAAGGEGVPSLTGCCAALLAVGPVSASASTVVVVVIGA